MSRAATTTGDEPVTFAVPFYRGVEYLRRAVASVTAQTSGNWRLLICDDSPGGDAAAVADATDPRVRYVRNDRTLGMAGNWNRCLDLAGTDLVTILHADDELLPNYAGLMAAAAAGHPSAAALFCGARVIGPNSAPVGSFADWVKRALAPGRGRVRRLRGPGSIARLLRVNFIMCPTVCYRRSALGTRRFDQRWRCVLDLAFFCRLLTDGDELVGLPNVAYAYRRHPGNATEEYAASLLKFAEEAALYDELAADAEARGWPAVARTGRAKVTVRLHLLFRAIGDLAAGRPAAAWAKARLLVRLSAARTGGRECAT